MVVKKFFKEHAYSFLYIFTLTFLLLAAYWTGGLLAGPQEYTRIVAPAAAISLAVLMIFGPRLWPAIFLSTLINGLWIQAPLTYLLFVAFGNALSAVIAVIALQKFINVKDFLKNVKNFLFFLGIGVGVNVTIRAFFRSYGIVIGGVSHVENLFHLYAFQFIRDASSILTITPLLLTFWWDFRIPQIRKRFPEALLLGALLSLSTYFAFSHSTHDRHMEMALMMMPLPVMILSVMRFSGRGAALSSCLIAMTAFIQTYRGLGPFQTGSLQVDFFHLGIFVSVFSVSGLMLTAFISERKDAEGALTNKEAYTRALFENITDIVTILEANGVIRYESPSITTVLGYSPEEMIGKDAFSFIHPDDRGKIFNLYSTRVKVIQAEAQVEYRFKHKNGGWVILESVAKNMAFDPVVEGIIVVSRDVTERKRTEKILAESEEKYRLLAENSTDMISRHDLSCVFLSVSPACRTLLGYDPEELVNRDMFEIVCQDDIAAIRECQTKILSGPAASASVQYRILHKTGKYVWVETNSRAVRDPLSGKPVEIVTVTRDITERREAERALRKSEARFRTLFKSNIIGILVADIQGKILEANDLFLSMMGFTREELQSGKVRWDAMTPPEWRAADDKANQDLKEHGFSGPWEKEYIRKDGTRVPILIGVTAFEKAEENPIVLAFVVDMRDSKMIQSQLQKLSTAIEQSPASVVITDIAGHIEYANPKFTNLTGYELSEVLGKNPRFLKSGEMSQEFYKDMWTTIKSGKEWRGEFHNKKKNGELYWEHAIISPIMSQDGKVTHFVAVKEDVTDKKLLESQLYQAQKMEAVGRLAGGIAHDFNNLLTVILSYSQLILETVHQSDTHYTGLSEILKAGERASHLTRQLLAFSRKQMFHARTLDLNLIVNGMDKLVRRLIGEDIELVTLFEPNLEPVKVDAGQMEQVIMNLVVNSRDAMPKGGKLVIQTQNVTLDAQTVRPYLGLVPGTYVVLSVSDTGCGMNEEIKAQIFEPFFTTKEKGKGTGLGLATVYGIVKQSHGFIYVDSEPGKGSVFNIYLPPVAEAPEALPATLPTQKLPRGTETILVVEDEELVRGLCVNVLQAQGYKILQANHGLEALRVAEEFKTGKIDLLLTDLIMPQMGGEEVAKKLKQTMPDIKVLFTSGYSDRFAGGEKGETPQFFLQKPYRPAELVSMVRKILDTPPAS